MENRRFTHAANSVSFFVMENTILPYAKVGHLWGT